MEFQAEWITARRLDRDVVPVFRKRFSLSAPVRQATLTITALGVYEASLNGARVGDFVLAPGWTSYRHRIQVQTYDVTARLAQHNELCVLVGRGWYSSPIGFDERALAWQRGRPRGLLAELCICYETGERQCIPTDQTWMYGESAIRFSEIYDGETCDATFVTPRWYPAERLDYPFDALIPQEGEEIREQERVQARDLIVTPQGDLVVDFGQEVTGYVEFSLPAHAGQKVRILHSEVLDRDGNFYNANYRAAKAEINYTCREGLNTYHPRLTFFGFRQIKLDRWPQPREEIRPQQFTAIVVHSQLRRTGHLACSSAKLNRFFSNVTWGQKGNFLDIPTDCPQRNERLGWTGDAQMFCKAASYNYDVNRFFRKWLRDLAVEQREAGGLVGHVVPDVLHNGDSSAAWGDAAVVIPWQLYQTYGDKRVLEEQFDSMRAWVDSITRTTTSPDLWTGGRHYGDWLALDAPAGSYRGTTRDDFIASAFYIWSTRLLIQAGRETGRDMTEYQALQNRQMAAFRSAFPTCTTQTECVLALQFGLTADPGRTAEELVRRIRQAGRMETGFVGTPYLLHVLSDNGFSELAYELLLREQYPSWLYAVNQGATTVWEHWDGIQENGDFWSADMNSFNHYAYGAVVDWVYEKAAGIRPAVPGFRRVVVEPVPTGRLDWLEASIDTVSGRVSSRWEHVDGKIRYEISLPVAGEVVICGVRHNLPAGSYVFWSQAPRAGTP